MSDNEQLARSLSTAFVNLMRQTALIETLKGPEVLFLFQKKFDQFYADGILNLEELYHDIAGAPGVTTEDLQGFLLLYREQETALGVKMQLPAELIMLAEKRRNMLTERIRRQIEQRLPKHQAKAQQEEDLQAEKITLKRKQKGKGRAALLIVMLLLGIASVAINLGARRPQKPMLEPVVGVDLKMIGLPGELEFKESIFILKVPRRDWDLIPRSEQRSRLLSLSKVLVPLGMYAIIVRDLEYTTIAVGGMSEINFIDRKPQS